MSRPAPAGRRALVRALVCLALASGCAASEQGAPDSGADKKVAPAARSTTFTTTLDFMRGELAGLSTDTDGDLRMASGLRLFETPYLWVPNSAENTVTRIDVKTGEKAGPFSLKSKAGEDCHNPSRTTVDQDYNMWVGCRGSAGGLNREDLKPEMVPATVDNKVVKLSKTDGAVLLSVRVGHGPRALALDAKNHLWVGCSVDDTVWEIDGQSGECYRGEAPGCAKPALKVANYPYGAAVDQRQRLWVVHVHDGLLTEIDTATGAVLAQYGPWKRNGSCVFLYGIAIDRHNDVWLGGWGCNDVVKVKGVAGLHQGDGKSYQAGQLIGSYSSGGNNTRGVAVDLDDNVWAANSGTHNATKLNGMTGKIIATVNVGDQPTGAGVDAQGNAWIVNMGSSSVHRVNGLNVMDTKEIAVGKGPYTYSDMLGTAYHLITKQGDATAYWRVVVDSQLTKPLWKQVTWSAETPGKSRLEVRTRCAPEEKGLASAAWGPALASPGPAHCAGAAARFLEARVSFVAAGADSPVLHSLTVYWE
jgi:streptogramin lyase